MRIAQSRTETGRLKMGPFLCSDLATWSGVSGEGLSFLHLAFLLWGTRERLYLLSVIHEHTNYTHTLVGVGLFKVCVVCPLVTARGVPGEGLESLPW